MNIMKNVIKIIAFIMLLFVFSTASADEGKVMDATVDSNIETTDSQVTDEVTENEAAANDVAEGEVCGSLIIDYSDNTYRMYWV